MIYLPPVSFILKSLNSNLTLEKQSINAQISQKSQIQLRLGAFKKTQNPFCLSQPKVHTSAMINKMGISLLSIFGLLIS
jgi:hypothetical protein